MIMFHGDPLMRRVTEIIDRVVETGLYKYWLSVEIDCQIIFVGKIVIVQPLDGYYSFNLYHMQTAFYLLFWMVFKCPLSYGRGVVQSSIKQNNVKLIMGGLLRRFINLAGLTPYDVTHG
jgi:hypothetical protein